VWRQSWFCCTFLIIPSQSDTLWALQNGCDKSSWLCWEHVHHAGESGPDLSILKSFAHATTVLWKKDYVSCKISSYQLRKRGHLGRKSPLSCQETAASKVDSWHDHNWSLASCKKQTNKQTNKQTDGVWTGGSQRQCTPSRQQVARDETEGPPRVRVWYPYPSLHVLSLFLQSAIRQGQRCMQLPLMHSHWTVDWTGLDWLGAATPVAPQGLEGSTPWRTCYKAARSKQGITASASLTCSNTAIAELTTGSNTPPTDLIDLRLTMQHKSGTA